MRTGGTISNAVKGRIGGPRQMEHRDQAGKSVWSL